MIKVLTSYTTEIDDIEAAVSSLLKQLAPEDNLLKNSAALVHCYYEFIESGVVEELADRLGIPVIGTTTMALGVQGYVGDTGLALMVLTSNDIRFSWGVSEPVISNEISKPVADLYKEVVAGFDSKPSLFFAFPPMLKGEGQGGDVFIAELDKVSGGNIPVFGSIPITNENGERMSRVLYMGKAFESSMALLAFYGDVKPEFYTAALSEKALYTKRVKVTGTKLNVIESINDMPVSRYLETIGLSPSSVLNNMPLVFYPPDGSRLFRVCQKIRDDGALIITGTVPLNAELSFSSISDKDVIESTENLIENIMAGKTADNRSLLIYACCSRFWMLGYRWKEEPGKAVSLIKEQIPWQFVYSGGELFPSILEAGKVSNHLQNYSVTVCVL